MSPDAVNQKLVDQYTEIARLAGGLAHEIKNPLSTIRLNMELLAEDFRESESPRDRRAMRKIELVERECQRLQDLLDGFLNFAKVRRLKLEPSDLNVQVLQVLDFFRPKAEEARIEIVDYLSSDLAMVLLDRESFHGALLNLVLNAQQAMPKGGQLVLRTYNTAAGRGPGLDRHRRRHGRRDAGPCLRRLLFHEEGRFRPGAAHDAEDHRGPRRADHLAKRAGPRHAIHDRVARSRPVAGRRARRQSFCPVQAGAGENDSADRMPQSRGTR